MDVATRLSRLVCAIHAREKVSLSDLGKALLHDDRAELKRLEREMLPHGTGFDNGCSVDVEASNDRKLVIQCDWHRMNDNGVYVGWVTHRAIVTAHFGGFDVKITGRDHGFKDYIAEVMYEYLGRPAPRKVE